MISNDRMEALKARHMVGRCCGHEPKFDGVSVAYKRVLLAIVAINGAMFCTELLAGVFAGSQALKADALDFLADTATYAITLLVIGIDLLPSGPARIMRVQGFMVPAPRFRR